MIHVVNPDVRPPGDASFRVGSSSDSSWSRRDWLCVAILAVLCLAIRLPALDALWLGVDQQQYLATAAYLHASHTSAFSDPYGPVYTFELYRIFASVFGPYTMVPVRLFVLLIALGMSVLLFLIVRRAVSRLYGLLSGSLFLCYNVFFEGLSANREWFSGPFILLGVYLLLLCLDKRLKRAHWLMAASGLCCGIAVWFKQQALPMTAIVPAVLAYQAFTQRQFRRKITFAVTYLAGLAVALALFFLPFAVAGTLTDYLAWIRHTTGAYVVQSAGLPPELAAGRGISQAQSMGVEQYFQAFYGHPFPMPLFLPYCLTLAWICGVLVAMVRRGAVVSPRASNPTLVVFVFYLLSAMFAVQLGRRFFPHYFLFVMPPIAVLFSLAVRWVVLLPRTRLTAGGIGCLAVLFLVLELSSRRQSHEAWFLGLALVLLAAALMFLLFGRPELCSRLARGFLFAVVCVQLVLLAGSLPTVVPVLSNRGILCGDKSISLTNVVSYLQSQSRAGDRLFVWGWRPELYTQSRLEPASTYTITSYVIQDAQVLRTGRVAIQPQQSKRLMQDLTERKPRFVVDASRRSLAMSHRWVYDLKHYPPLEEHLDKHYVLVTTLDDCDVYARRDS